MQLGRISFGMNAMILNGNRWHAAALMRYLLQKCRIRMLPADVQEELNSNVCGHFFFSRTGLVNNLKLMDQERIKHLLRKFYHYVHHSIPYPTCGLVYSLTRHFKIHKDEFQLVTAKDEQFKYHIFNFPHLYKF